MLELLFTKLSRFAPSQNLNTGFWPGLLLGFSLGLVWTPCVGPIIASVITLAATSSVNLTTVFITLSYSIGTAIPMLGITYGGRQALQKVPWLTNNTPNIQKGFGVLMILTALAIFFNLDRGFQTFILDKFPNYGAGLTKIEDNKLVDNQLQNLGTNQYPAAPELIPGGQWFNTQPLTLASLKGKVVLIDFWTYTCINCIRTLPYTKTWYDKYKDKGFVLIGVHSPEFEFEKSSDNVKKAISDFGIKYPVMQDNNYDTWKAFNNHYWPAEYLIDAKGNIRDSHPGEGDYDQTEKKIQDLLKEAGNNITDSITQMDAQMPVTTISPETYLGSKRMEFYYPDNSLGNGTKNFNSNNNTPQNSFTLDGQWQITDENAVTGQGAILNYNFYANKVFLVLRPGTANNSKVKVFLDGKQVDSSNAGSDVKSGIVTIDQDKLYNLIDLKGNLGNHLLRLEFQNPGAEAFAFTFG